jgi:hypothetical protein
MSPKEELVKEWLRPADDDLTGLFTKNYHKYKRTKGGENGS